VGRGLPGATAAAAGMGDPNLWGLLAGTGYQKLWQLFFSENGWMHFLKIWKIMLMYVYILNIC
jgi:hypothetical protein